MISSRPSPVIGLLLVLLLAPLSPAASALEPFVARYAAYYDGSAAGTATMQVVQQADQHWRIDLNLRGSRGMARVMGLTIEQSTVFDQSADGQFRPLHQRQIQGSRLNSKRSSGRYDWQAGIAQWSGDIKPGRQQPIPLQPGDMDGLLLNLALSRDAAPGRMLDYRYVDAGRMRQYQYQAAARSEPIQIGGRDWQALRVERKQTDNDATVVWVSDGMPVPVRILHRKDGKDQIDLHLIDYQGAP